MHINIIPPVISATIKSLIVHFAAFLISFSVCNSIAFMKCTFRFAGFAFGLSFKLVCVSIGSIAIVNPYNTPFVTIHNRFANFNGEQSIVRHVDKGRLINFLCSVPCISVNENNTCTNVTPSPTE